MEQERFDSVYEQKLNDKRDGIEFTVWPYFCSILMVYVRALYLVSICLQLQRYCRVPSVRIYKIHINPMDRENESESESEHRKEKKLNTNCECREGRCINKKCALIGRRTLSDYIFIFLSFLFFFFYSNHWNGKMR